MVASLPRAVVRRVLVVSGLLLAGQEVLAQAPNMADMAADMLLNAARKAHNEKQFPFAADRYREFLQKYGNHPNAIAARHGLALCLLDAPERNFTAAIEQLTPIAGNKDFAEHPSVLFHLGLAHRGLAAREIAEGLAKPNEMPQRKQNAQQRFAEAAGWYEQASATYLARVPNDEKTPSDALNWAARARCDQAEMQLRLDWIKEARATVEPFARDAQPWKRSKYRPYGLYLYGFASFLQQDYDAAGAALTQLAPYSQPIYGTHAGYLMGRVFQLQGDAVAARQAYQTVLARHDEEKKAAEKTLQQPDQLRYQPEELARLQRLLQGPAPDHVAAAQFHLASLQYEAGQFGPALDGLQNFVKTYPQSPLLPDAQLRIGLCQVQMRSYPEAIATLTPLANQQTRWTDQALFWLGKAQAGNALNLTDPMKVTERDNSLRTAIQTLRNAADRAGQLANNDPDAKRRRGEALMELADVLLHAKQPRDAAEAYKAILNEKLPLQRDEEITHRLAVAYQLAGDFAKSDQIIAKFVSDYPKSPLLAVMAFRQAENAYFTALAAEKNPNFPNRATELPKLFAEAGKRYQAMIDKYPEHERVSLARFGLAMTHFKVDAYEAAAKALEAIPAPERSGDLATVPYLLAECYLRQLPLRADDALADGILGEKLENARQLLEGFLAANPQARECPDAMLKLGYCYQRLAARLAMPNERNQMLGNARATYEKLIQQFPREPQMPQAVLERAKVFQLAGDKGTAINELRRFLGDPLQQTNAAAPATILLATLLREQNNPTEAAQVLANARPKLEAFLAKDPKLAEWNGLLRYHHGVALQEWGRHLDQAGKLAEALPRWAEARTLLETLPQLQPNKPIVVEALLRSGQCRLLEGRRTIEAARQRLAAGGKPEELNAANQQLNLGYTSVSEAAQTLERRAEEFKAAFPQLDARARMLYDAAWGYRILAEREVANATQKLQLEAQKKLIDEAMKGKPQGTKPPIVPLPEIARATVPLQPLEAKTRAVYKAMIDAFSDLAISVTARFELGELFAEREEFEPAIALLKEALDKEPTDQVPPPELVDRIRLRLGTCLAAVKKYEDAIAQFEPVANHEKALPELRAQALYRLGECLLDLGNPAKAAERLLAFRDRDPFCNLPGLTDRALYRLGHAYGQLKQWEACRQSLDVLFQRFGASPWVPEARYLYGWSLQSQKQFDAAVHLYQQVIASSLGELGARAHLQIGICYMEQGRFAEAATALLVVPFTYDQPELHPIALFKAAECLTQLKQPEQAERVLRKLIKEAPDSDWAKLAQKKLAAMP